MDSKVQPKKILQKRNKIQEFIVGETLIKVSNDYVWVWVAIEPIGRVILDIRISFERTMLVAEQFLKGLVKKYGKHSISTDGGAWYPQGCKFLNISITFTHFMRKELLKGVSIFER